MYFDNNIDNVLKGIENLLHGLNYDVCLRLDIFSGNTVEDFERQLKNKYPGAEPHSCKLLPIEIRQLLAGINQGLDYRGDRGAGVLLTPEKEQDFINLKGKYLKFLNQFLTQELSVFIILIQKEFLVILFFGDSDMSSLPTTTRYSLFMELHLIRSRLQNSRLHGFCVIVG